MAAGNAHTCALRDNHQVKCWGLDADGEPRHALFLTCLPIIGVRTR